MRVLSSRTRCLNSTWEFTQTAVNKKLKFATCIGRTDYQKLVRIPVLMANCLVVSVVGKKFKYIVPLVQEGALETRIFFGTLKYL